VKNYALSGLEKNIQNILVEQISNSMHHKYGVISNYLIENFQSIFKNHNFVYQLIHCIIEF